MSRYRITNRNSGAILGEYEGATEAEALDAMAVDAGYKSHADACRETHTDGGDLLVTARATEMSRADQHHPLSCQCEFCALDEEGIDEAGYCVHCGEQRLFEQECACWDDTRSSDEHSA